MSILSDLKIPVEFTVSYSVRTFNYKNNVYTHNSDLVHNRQGKTWLTLPSLIQLNPTAIPGICTQGI